MYDPNTEPGTKFKCDDWIESKYSKPGGWTITHQDRCSLYCSNERKAVTSVYCKAGEWKGEPERGFWCYNRPESLGPSDDLEALNTAINTLETDITGVRTDITDVNTAINSLETGITGVETDITALKDDLEAMNTAINTLETDITGVRTNITGVRTDITGVRTDITDVRTDITDVNIAINSLETGVETDITALKDDLEALNTAINTLETGFTGVSKNITDVRTDITDVRTDITGVRTDITGVRTDITGVKTDITALKGYINTCAYHDGTRIKSKTITYDKLLLSSSNLGQLGEGLNIKTGLFTAPATGDYMVTYSLWTGLDNGDSRVYIFIMKKGVKIGESQHQSAYSGSSGFVIDQGGRSIIIHLAKGETTSLYCQDCSANVYDITFCVSLTTPTSSG